MRERCLQLLRCLGLLMGLLCVLAGCGGNGGSSNTTGTVSRGRPLSLQFRLSSQALAQAVSVARYERLTAAQARQVQPGDPGFIERIEIRLQAQGSDLVPPQVFTLDPTEQETVTLEVMVPDTAPATFQVLVSAFNPQGIEVFRGDTSVALGQTSAVVTLFRAALVPVPATPANLQQTTFAFADGAIFGLANIPVTLATGTFVGHIGDFALTANGLVASGSLAIGSCTLLVTTSTFPVGQGLQVGDQLVLDPCQVDAIDRRLIVTNAILRLTAISSPPVVIPPDTTLNLPTPSTLIIAEDTSGALQIGVSVSGTRPGTITLGITIPPAHGTATLTNTGVVTYQPVANFHSSDRLVVTVVVIFTDNNSPALLLGTVPILITVLPVNDAPVLTSPGNQTSQEGATVALNIVASDGEGDTFSFSATNLPPGLSINTTTGIISGTIASGAATGSPYNVTVKVSDGLDSTSLSFLWTVFQGNRAPVPTAPAISTLLNIPGTSQLSTNDPDVGQSQTFAITTSPAHGMATVNATGLVTYTPKTNFIGTDSLVVTVTDNGTPPLAGTVTISVTITIPGVIAWTTPAPASVASGQAFPLALTVTGNFQQVSGEVFACPTTVPVDQCFGSQGQETPSSFSQVQVTPSSFAGPPGTFSFTAQGIDCQGSEDIYFVAHLFLLLPGGSPSLGPFFGPQTTTTLQVATGPLLQAFPNALTFNALAGLNPPPQTLSLTSACGQSLNFTGASNVPWLQLTPTTGSIGGGVQQQVAVAVDVTRLSTAQSPLAATVTFTAPGALNSLVVSVTLNLLNVTATWTTPAPASVASGQVFPLVLTVTGNFQQVSGEVFACPTTVPVEQCFGSQVQVTPFSFAGPPGTFSFTAQGSDCLQSEDIYFVAHLFLLLPGGSPSLGSFFGPQTTTTLQVATGPLLQVPNALTINAFVGLNPPPRTLVLTSACGQSLNFTGASNVPWLQLTPTTGTVTGFGQQQVAVAVDVMGLSTAQSPLAATVTFTAPGALNSPVVSVTLNLVGP